MMILQHVLVALCGFAAISSVQASNLRKLGSTYQQSDSDWKQQMLARVNEERAKHGLPSLCLNSKLSSASQRHSEDMAAHNYMDHAGADGSTMSSRITDAGYDWTYIEENVAAGQVDVDAVMESWMNSEGHRANILGKDVTMLGCAYAYSEDTTYGHYWTQDFGASSVDECDGSSSAADQTPAQNQQKQSEVQGEAEQQTDAPTSAPVATPAATTTAPAATPAPTAAPVATHATSTVQVVTPAPTTATTTSTSQPSGCHSQF